MGDEGLIYHALVYKKKKETIIQCEDLLKRMYPMILGFEEHRHTAGCDGHNQCLCVYMEELLGNL